MRATYGWSRARACRKKIAFAYTVAQSIKPSASIAKGSEKEAQLWLRGPRLWDSATRAYGWKLGAECHGSAERKLIKPVGVRYTPPVGHCTCRLESKLAATTTTTTVQQRTTHDIVPSELEHPADGVSDDGAPEVSHVHFLGDVGAREVHHHALRVGDPAATSAQQDAPRRTSWVVCGNHGGNHGQVAMENGSNQSYYTNLGQPCPDIEARSATTTKTTTIKPLTTTIKRVSRGHP